MTKLFPIVLISLLMFSCNNKSNNFITKDFSGEWKVSGKTERGPLPENTTYVFNKNNKDFFKDNDWKYYNSENSFNCDDCNEYENNYLMKSNRIMVVDYLQGNYFGYWNIVDDTLFLYSIDDYQYNDIEIMTPEKLIFKFIDNNLVELNYFDQRKKHVDKGKIFFTKD
tara:strand:- start:115 stop:618 length:504 start_codon:yes stop_codon:yes gene_type:complete